MKAREFDPLRLDLAAFAAAGESLSGSWPIGELPRLAASAHAEARPAPGETLQWSARGERRPRRAAEPETWLHLQLDAVLKLECQRCLQPVETPLHVERWLRFVPGEEQAAALDAESEEDVLALPRWLDLRELTEDELLLALPLVPRHEQCPAPLPSSAGEAVEVERENPFAALQALKRDAGH
jgi:uncharacterized protein